MYKKFLILFLFLLNVSFASAALSWAEWTANHNTDITITNGQLSEFEWTVQAVSNYQGIQGRYSIWLFRNGNNNPIRTYFSNQPTINNGAGGYINVTPSDYQNLIGDYQVKVYSVDYFGGNTHVINLHVIPAQDPLTVSCNANPTQGQAPLTTTYTATVSGGSGIYNSYFWNFNDGQTQTTSTNNVQHTYNNAGTYNGIITVTDNQGHTATANCPTITVTPQPTPLTASCNAYPTSGYKPLNVNFTGTASGGSGTYYYYWTYGDGQSQNGNNKTTHTYNNAGTYHPTLKVTDTQNNQITVNCPTINVNNYPPITGTCTAIPTNGTRPLTVQFQVTAQGGSGTYNAYGWDFLGNNQLNTQGNTATYIYQNAGTYNPDVTVYDNQGNQGTITCPTITVNNPAPQLTASCNAYPTSGYEPLNVNFTGTASGGSGTYYYYWTFDDGQSQYGQSTITHTYNNNGTYHPTLKVTDTQNHITTVNCPTINVNNYPPITGTCNVNPTNGYAPLDVNITINAQGGSGTYTSYKYIFGDGQTQTITLNKIMHTYYNPGYYNPNVIVTDNKGNQGTINCPQVSVYQQPIINYTLNCAAYPTSGYTPLNVNFNATISTNSNEESIDQNNNDIPSTTWSYIWTFDDGQTLTNGPNVQHTYNAGTFHPTVQATNGNVTLVKNCPTITAIQTLQNITGTCYANPTNGYAPLTTNFTVYATGGTGTYTSYYWIFDDGQSQTTSNYKTTHTYQNIGLFNPTVKVTDNQGNTGTINCPKITVQEPPKPLTATCDAYPTSGYEPLNVNFTGTASGGSGTYYYYWTFDDGQSQYGQSTITHTYQNNGTYHPTLKVTDTQNHIVTVNCPTINVYNQPIINYTLNCTAYPTQGIEPLDVEFNAYITSDTATNDDKIPPPITQCNDNPESWIYTWIFDDGQLLMNGPNVWHTYNAGIFHPTVQATDGCITLYANCPTITVEEEPEPLEVTCNAIPTSGFEPLEVDFYGTATGGSGTYYYYWTYGDGYSQYALNETTHTYQNNGTYHPTLKVTDTQNHIKTVNCPTITVIDTVPLYGTCYIDPSMGYEPLDVNFSVSAQGGTGNYVSYKYVFDDGTTTTLLQNKTMHTYFDAGAYHPYVVVKDDMNNSGTIYCGKVIVFEQVSNLTASCNAYPTSGYAPLETTFEATANGGTGGYSYRWYFGDGISSWSNNSVIIHTYNDPGQYYPTLKVTDSSGTQVWIDCPNIHVLPPIINNTLTCIANPTYGVAPLDVEFNAYITPDTDNADSINNDYASDTDCFSSTWTYTWIFDDGQLLMNGPNVWHTYNAGIFHPTVQATDGCETLYANCPTITVTPPTQNLTASCNAYPTSGYEPLNVNFTGTASGGSGTYYYYWYFDDGYSQYGQSTITHTYQNNGTYHPTLKVTDSQNHIVTVNCPTINVNNQPIIQTLNCTAIPTQGIEPLDVEFNAIGLEDSADSLKASNNIASTDSADCFSTTWTYTWTFDDGQTLVDGSNVWHTYNAGIFHPTVQATDGCETLYANCPTITVEEEPLQNITGTCYANPTNGYAPLTTNFTVYATGGTGTYTSYKYIFGDGQTQTTSNYKTTHTYQNIGLFYPTVKVTDNQGNTGTINCPTITVQEPPTPLTATCDAYPTSGYEPLEVDFTGTASGGSGTYYYYWTFDDGQSQYGQSTITHTYQNNGTYHPTLKVTDTQNHIVTVNCPTINVENEPTIQNITGTCYANPTNGNAPLTTNFTVYATGGTGTYTSYKYIFGDGQTQTITLNKIMHTYNYPGLYNPTVVVMDNQGNFGTINCPTIEVYHQQINFTLDCSAHPTSGTEPLDVEFNAEITPNTENPIYTDEEDCDNPMYWIYTWTFDDGQTLVDGSNVWHTYNTGTFHPTVKATLGCTNIYANCPTITVTPPTQNLTASCDAYPTSGYEPLEVDFTGTASGGSGTYYYYWYFDDGYSQYGQSTITHTYQNNGTYHPTLKVTDTQNHITTVNCPTINVNNQPTINYTLTCDANPTNGYEPLNVNFNAQVTMTTNAAEADSTSQWTYIWTFNDGQTLVDGSNVWHTYNQGVYHPTVKAISDGKPTLYANCPTINVEEQPIIISGVCDARPTSGTEPLDVNLSFISAGIARPYTYKWIFDDGTSLINGGSKVTHTYDAGTYNPTLIVSYQGLSETFNCPTINVDESQQNLTASCNAYPTSGYEPLNVNFTGTASGGSGTYYYYWTFDDGQSQYGQSTITHTYQNNGTYHPTLKVTDTQNHITTVNCPTINVENEPTIQNITGTCYANPTNGNAPLTTNFTVYATGGTGNYNYNWIFDDGTTTQTSQNNILHTYNYPGTYDPTITITDNQGNTGTINCPTIEVNHQQINFTLDCSAYPTQGTEPLEVEFNAEITPNTENPIYTDEEDCDNPMYWIYTWTFDDGQTLTNGPNVWHTYNTGTFHPTVKATLGCTNIYANCPTINVENGNNILIADPNGPYKDYVNTQIMFDGSGSEGEIVRYVWDFGDGTIVELGSPYAYHSYNNKIGIFPVKLTVYDIYGFNAVGYTTATIIEPTNFKQDEENVKDGLWIGKIIMVGDDGIQEVARSNDDVFFNIELANDYDYDLEDARIIIEIPELGIKQKSTAFDLRTGQEKSQSMNVPIWSAPEGWYEVKIIVQDDNVRRVKYRDLFVSDRYKEGCSDCKAGVY